MTHEELLSGRDDAHLVQGPAYVTGVSSCILHTERGEMTWTLDGDRWYGTVSPPHVMVGGIAVLDAEGLVWTWHGHANFKESVLPHLAGLYEAIIAQQIGVTSTPAPALENS
jgi:hypothetical protein